MTGTWKSQKPCKNGRKATVKDSKHTDCSLLSKESEYSTSKNRNNSNLSQKASFSAMGSEMEEVWRGKMKNVVRTLLTPVTGSTRPRRSSW